MCEEDEFEGGVAGRENRENIVEELERGQVDDEGDAANEEELEELR